MNKHYSLYIHIPFCKSKCYYCDFYSVVANNEIITKYITAIEQEIIFLQSKYNIVNPKIVTLYIGGGTPSLLNREQLISLFEIIANYYNLSLLREVTIEANPESVTKDWIETVNNIIHRINNNQIKLRISLGVQSFSDKTLELLGRQHRVYHVLNAVELFHQTGVFNYNFDIMFGCPEQTLIDVVNEINQAIKLSPVHISFYALTVEPGTKLYKEKFLPDGDLQADMYKQVSRILYKHGYRCYEISNFAKPGFECLHNLNYWLYKEYIGLGTSAVSFINQKRIKNVSNIENYIKNKYKYKQENISHNTACKEQIMLGLRTDRGISEKNITVQKYAKIVDNLLKRGLLVKQKQYLKIPLKYRFVSNAIISEFM